MVCAATADGEHRAATDSRRRRLRPEVNVTDDKVTVLAVRSLRRRALSAARAASRHLLRDRGPSPDTQVRVAVPEVIEVGTWGGIPVFSVPDGVPDDFIGVMDKSHWPALNIVHFYAPGCSYVTAYVPSMPGAGEIHVRHYGAGG